MRKSSFQIILMGIFLCVGMGTAAAHQSDESMHVAEVRPESGEVEQLISISAEDLAHHFDHVGHDEFPSPAILEAAHDTFLEYMEFNTPVKADGEDCKLEESEFVGYPGPDGRLHYHQLWKCPEGSEEITLRNTVLFDMHGGGYRHMARVQVGDAITPAVFDANFEEYHVYLGEEDGESGEVAQLKNAPRDVVDLEGEEEKSLVWLIFSVVAFVLVMGALFMGRQK